MENKKFIIKELAKLELLNWSENEKVASSIFPYVLVEAINLLKNSEIIKNPTNYTGSGEAVKHMLNQIITEVRQ